MPKPLVRVTGALMALALCAACAQTSRSAASPAAAGTPKTLTFGFVNGARTEFHTCLEKSVEATAKAFKAQVITLNSEQDARTELSNVQALLAKHVDALIVQTVDDTTLAADVADAKAAGIPIFLTSVDGNDTTDILGAVVVDLDRVGRLDASWVSNDAAGRPAQAAIIAGAPGAASDLLVKGFTAGLPANVTVVASQPGMFVRAKAASAAEQIIKAHPDLRYAFVANEDMAFGARQAFTAAGKDVDIVTVNGTSEGLAAVKAGRFSATVANSARQIGNEAVTNAVGLLQKLNIDKVTGVPITLITKDNLAEAPTYCG